MEDQDSSTGVQESALGDGRSSKVVDEPEDSFGQRQFTARSTRPGIQRQQAKLDIGKEAYKHLFHPDGFGPHLFSLVLSLIALTFTAAGSWDCNYFHGADIKFTGGDYGLWTMKDSDDKCQLWDVLFFNYDLGGHLIAARVFSMTAMLVGLGLTATMAQASQFHIVTWGIALSLFIVFIVSVSTTSIYNVWSVFWLWSYAICVLIARCTFIHPVPRHISARGSKVIAGFFVLCSMMCLLTLVVLGSDFCTCSGITSEKLQDRNIGEPCDGTCELKSAGILMIFASPLWLGAAISCVKFGVQPDELKTNRRRPAEWYANYNNKSLYTKAMDVFNYKKTKEDSSSKAMKDSAKTSGTSGNIAKTGLEDVDLDSENENKDSPSDGKPSVHSGEDSDDEEEDDDQELELDQEDVLSPGERNLCQKCCCDYRVKPRNRTEKILFWGFRFGLVCGFAVYVLFIVMLIGSRRENTKSSELPSTTKYFTTPYVCAFNPADPWNTFETFPDENAARAKNMTIAHCGKCSFCSNPHDITVYIETRKTIAEKSKKCGPEVFLGTYKSLADCLERKIGFTRPCTNCWADNMITTGEKCLMTCMRNLFSGFMTDNNVQGAGDEGWLNQCLYCDEKNSGPAFVTCSGVARRRLGIKSEIERNPQEQCTRVDVNWTDVDLAAIGFYRNNSLI